jgi:hypothetical protein
MADLLIPTRPSSLTLASGPLTLIVDSMPAILDELTG